MTKEDGEQLVSAAEENSGDGLAIKLGGDPIYRAQEGASPEGIGFLGAAIVLLIAFGSLVAAGLPLVIALVGLGISSRRADRRCSPTSSTSPTGPSRSRA